MHMIDQLKQGATDWLEERTKLSVFTKILAKKTVPKHEQTFWYYFGGMALFLLILQIVTGLLLMVYYQPGIESSYASVKYIIEEVSFGQLIRSIHSWSANLMIGVIFIHMFCAYFMKAYRRPRELTWLTGFGLLMISFGLGFSGYLLTWDELAYFATKIGLQIMSVTPFVGPLMADLLRGGSELGGATISRFFELHVLLLPAALIGLLTAHLILVQIHGMSTPYSYANKPARLRKSIPFFSDFLYHDILIWTLMMGGIVILAWTYPWPLGPEADPWAPAPEGIKPEWYFIFMFQILKLLPAHVGPIEGEVFGIMMFGVGGALWALVPFWEGINKWTSKLATSYGVLALLVIIIPTIAAYMPSPDAPLSSSVAAVDKSAISGDTAALFKQSCAACHSIGGGNLVGPDLKGLTENRDREQLARFIVDPSGSAMPKIPGITEADAKALLDYIEAESNPKPDNIPTKVAEAPAEKPFTEAHVTDGRKLFLGMKPFASGGTACMACHSVQDNSTLGGGTMGPDLTQVYHRLGERKGFSAWMAAIPSPTMKPLYDKHPLTEEEIHVLSAYFAKVSEVASQPETIAHQRDTRFNFFIFGAVGAVLLMVAIALLYHNRFRTVRRALVEQEIQNKETEG